METEGFAAGKFGNKFRIALLFQVHQFLLSDTGSFVEWEIPAVGYFLAGGNIVLHLSSLLSYTIDVYRRELVPLNRLLDYTFLCVFFSAAGSGAYCTCPRFYSSNQATAVCFLGDVWHWCFLYHQRIIQESCISDYISVNFVERIFDNPALYSGVENLFGVYGYALQIYCDFSGYSDMAIGFALLLGFRFPMNF